MSVRNLKVLFLDRDGVVNADSSTFIKHPDEWVPIPGSLDAIARATRAGWHCLVVSNQSGVGRGLFDLDTLHAIHAKMMEAVRELGGRIDGILFCPHTPGDGCDCRKPKPGLLREAAARLNIDLQSTWMVGDRHGDLAAAEAVGAGRILVRTGHGAETETELTPGDKDVVVVDDLAAAVDFLLTREG